MNNVKLLLKANLINSYGINRFLKQSSKSEQIKMLLLAVAILWAIVVLFSSAFSYFNMVSDVLVQLDSLSVLLVISFINISIVSLFMSIYKASGYLFSFKDYDLLMSLPVKTSEVLICKLLLLYIANFMITFIIGLPSLIAYGIKSSSGVVYYIFAFIALFFISLFPMIIGAAFSFIIGKISSRFKSSNIAMIIGSFALFLLIMIGSNFIGNVSPEFIQDISGLMEVITKAYYPIYLYVNALVNVDILYLIGFILISTIPFFLLVYLFSKSFKYINSKMNESFKASNYKMESLRVSSPLKSLYKKELSFYFSSHVYVLNTATGMVMMTILTICIAVFGEDKVAQVLELPMMGEFIFPVVTAIACMCVCLSCTTSSSISLEGKKLWIVKSLPIEPIEILKSKILVNLTIIVPLLIINSVILAISLRIVLVQYLLFLVITILYAVLISMTGIMVNLYLPKFEWKSHTEVVKQSASSVISILTGTIFVAIPIFIYINIKPANFNIFSIIVALGLFILNIILWIIIKTKGVKIFELLNSE